MTTNAETERTQIQRAMPLTRILRLLTGLSPVLITVANFRQGDPQWIVSTIGVAAALVPFYALVHYLVGAYLPRLNRWLGAALAVTPVGLLFFLGPSWATVGAVVFVGVSLLLTAILGDPGCVRGHVDPRALPQQAHAPRLHRIHASRLGRGEDRQGDQKLRSTRNPSQRYNSACLRQPCL